MEGSHPFEPCSRYVQVAAGHPRQHGRARGNHYGRARQNLAGCKGIVIQRFGWHVRVSRF
eukprot:scaffold7485_cov403-Prasinococcus_capsulatus_cf.AAC.2